MFNADFNITKNLKTPTTKQNPSTFLGKIGISTTDNIALTIPLPGSFEFISGKKVQKIGITGYTDSMPNGNQLQVIGDTLWEIDCTIKLYGDYIIFRNKLISVLQSNKSFAIQTYTTQNNQTIPIIYPQSKKNYFVGIATNISFSDTYDGKKIGGQDTIRFRFLVTPEIKKQSIAPSLFETLEKCVNFLDNIQTNIAFASLQITNVNNTLIEFAKSISSFGSDVSGFIASLKSINASVGKLVQSPVELSKTFKTVTKDFGRLFSSFGNENVKKYYTNLNKLAKNTSNERLEQTQTRLADGSYLLINDNIIKNIISSKASFFLKSIAISIICDIYSNYQFNTKQEGLDIWNNIKSLFEDIVNNSNNAFLANIEPSLLETQILDPEALNQLINFVFSTLEKIRDSIFSLKDLESKTVTSKSNVYELVGKYYGNLEKLNDFIALNNIAQYYNIIEPNTEIKFL